MAGIVAAKTDNAEGVAGVGYAGVSVMPVKVLGADGTGQDSDVIAGLVWAVNHGADVALMSFSAPEFSPALQTAIDWAWDQGVVPVAAVGNDSSSTATFPAGDRGVVGVSSTDTADALASSSNSGPAVFLAAPGENIKSLAVVGESPRSPVRPQRPPSSPARPVCWPRPTRPPVLVCSSAAWRATPTLPALPSRPATAASTSAAP